MSHALLSPSASQRWMACPPSARTAEFLADSESSYALDGKIAHSAAEGKLNHRLGRTEHVSICSDAEMDEYTTDYADFVMEQMEGLKDPDVYVEQRLDCSRYVPECFGTCDALIVSDSVLHIIDLKSGRGVKVDAEENDQLRIYSLGAMQMFDFLYQFDTVRMSIYQPRLGNVQTWETTAEALTEWAETVLAPAAKLAWEGGGGYRVGDHCRFCKAKAECRARAEANMVLAAYDFIEPALLETREVADILGKIDGLVSWASDVKDFALSKAMAGTKYDGWKVVAGRSNRKYTDEDAAAAVVKDAGYDPYEHRLLGITSMTSLLGRKKFDELLGGLTCKPEGKPVLVPEADKRNELNTAADDFADPIEN